MKKVSEVFLKFYRFGVVPLLALTMALAVCTIFEMGRRGGRLQNDGALVPVSVEGEISVDGAAFIPFDPEAPFDMKSHHVYRVCGHFTEDIEKNHQIMLRISDLWVRLSVNGREVFAFGEDLLHSAGNVWQPFTSPGITREDEVEFKIYNLYTGVHPRSINQLFTGMSYGSMDGLYRRVFRQNGLSLLVGFLIFVIGVCEGMVGAAMFLIRQEGVGRVLLSAGFAIFSGVWFCIQFNIISLLIPYPAAVATADVLSPYLMSAFFALYISTYLTGKRRVFVHMIAAVMMVFTLACISLVLYAGMDAYRTISLGWALAVLDLILSLLQLGAEYRRSHSRAIRLLGLSLLPILVGTLMDAAGFWSGLSNETKWLRICFLVFVIIQLTSIANQIRENSRRAERIENELTQNRISVMLSQIQPHFLYNILTAISQLCDTDSRKAKEAVIEFSNYLRGNLDALTQKALVPFEKELEHIQVYLSLEKTRFEDRLTILYDIQASDFLLPALTVQPIVENAVRYGASRKAGGGTVRITTRETAGAYFIMVFDDGAGFDPDRPPPAGRTHIGLQNVRSRLAAQCGGTLSVRSAPGAGTTVTIQIPK